MFDKDLYVETFSTLHASKDTLTEIQKITSRSPRRAKHPPRHAFILTIILVLFVSSAALAAGTRTMGGWVHHVSRRAVEKLGFHYPEQLGEYRLSSGFPSCIHVTSTESSVLRAWLNPDYKWMSLEYKNDTDQTLSVCFGKTNHPLWEYCFDYRIQSASCIVGSSETDKPNSTKQKKTSVWTGVENPDNFTPSSTDSRSYIENVTESVYEGCTIYSADRITEYVPDSNVSAEDFTEKNILAKESDRKTIPTKQTKEVEAYWVDSKAGLCFSISSGTNRPLEENRDSISDRQNISQEEMLDYVKSIIDSNR